MWVTLTAAIIHFVVFLEAAILDPQLDWHRRIFCRRNSIVQRISRPAAAIHSDYFHAGSESRFCCRQFRIDVEYHAFRVHNQANRVGKIYEPTLLLVEPNFLVWLLVINQLPAAVSNSTQRRACVDYVDTLVKESTPVVRRHLVKRVHDVVEGVSPDHGPRVLAAMKFVAEIIKRQLAL